MGRASACLIDSNKSLWCLGRGKYGSIGDGTTDDADFPKKIMNNVDDIVVGGVAACTLTTDGSVWCWGDNTYGTVGNGTTDPQLTPKKVELPKIKQISLSDRTSCALTNSGEVFCWGYNGDYQLKNGSVENSPTPQKINMPEKIDKIYAGVQHSCAKTVSGSFICWGDNFFGQLGIGKNTSDQEFHKVSYTTPIKDISLGYFFSCAITADDQVICAGINDHGQLGSGTSDLSSNIFIPIKNSVPAIAVQVGLYHACALLVSKDIICWGNNIFGELGAGLDSIEHPSNSIPVPVKNLNNVESFNSGSSTTSSICAITTENDIFCWGENFIGIQQNTSPVAATWAD